MRADERINFEVAFASIPDPVIDIWHALTSFLHAHDCLPTKFEVSPIIVHPDAHCTTERLKLSADEITKLMSAHRWTRFIVHAGEYPGAVSYWFVSENEQGPSTLRAVIDRQAKVPKEWNTLIEGLAKSNACVGAWQWNVGYEAWQNASELHSSYSTLYGPPPPNARRFVIKSIDGIGPDREFMDVSRHPGRSRQLSSRITFYSAAEMWLGPHFWQYAKCTKEEALAADFFVEKRDTPHFLYLKCWPEPFTRPDGAQGRMQQRLWKLFFHEDCEWPPGSGTICDDPVYGPRELMA